MTRPHTTYRVWVFTLLLTCSFAQSVPSKTASVTFRVVDPFGHELPYRVTSFQSRNGKDLASEFRGLRVSPVPYGHYHYRLVRSDYKADIAVVKGDLWVNHPDHWQTLKAQGIVVTNDEGKEISYDLTLPPTFVQMGSVEGLPPGANEARIRFQSPYDAEAVEVRVDPSGRFQLYDVLEGRFLAIVFVGDQLLHIEDISFPIVTPGKLSRPLIVLHVK